MSVTVNISFETLLQTVANLDKSEKKQIWDFLETELQADELDDLEEAEVALAYQDYEQGNYVTLDEYHSDRLSRANETPRWAIRDKIDDVRHLIIVGRCQHRKDIYREK